MEGLLSGILWYTAEEPLLLSVYLTIVVNKAEIEKHIAISINSPYYYYNKWISL